MDYITTTEVAQMIGVSRGTILNYIKAGSFARGYRLSARKTVFRRDDITRWLETRVR